jgi:hypothetical protein
MRLTIKLTATLGAIAFFGGAYATPASAQATRTWVSGVGDDLNPCSRTAPCKTFAGAVSKTAAGGEINCLDPGGFGAVTLTKSMTIDCRNTMGGVLNSSVNGVSINDSASGFPNSIHVILRGISIDGAQSVAQNASGNPGSGLTGINFTSGASLVVEDVLIQNQNGTTSIGLRFAPAGAAQLSVTNTLITDNGSAGVGGGIRISPSGVSGTARVVLNNVRVTNNLNNALTVDTTGNTSGQGITILVNDSQFTNSGANGISILQPAGTQSIVMMVDRSTIGGNVATGITAAGAGVIVRVADTTITGNATGVSASGGAAINSFGTNRLIGNPSVGAPNNGTFTGGIVLQN